MRILRAPLRSDLSLKEFRNTTAISGYAHSQRPRREILGSCPRINRGTGSSIRVLLVDDEPALTNLVKMALHYEGWDVEIAHNGREAIPRFDKVNPDVLVLDIMLPDVDGLRSCGMTDEDSLTTLGRAFP